MDGHFVDRMDVKIQGKIPNKIVHCRVLVVPILMAGARYGFPPKQ